MVAFDSAAAEDEARFRDLMQAQHYLGAVPEMGETMRHVTHIATDGWRSWCSRYHRSTAGAPTAITARHALVTHAWPVDGFLDGTAGPGGLRHETGVSRPITGFPCATFRFLTAGNQSAARRWWARNSTVRCQASRAASSS